MSNQYEVIEVKEIATDRDARVFEHMVQRNDKRWKVWVYISGTLMASEPSTLALPEREAVVTYGRSAVEHALSRSKTPRRIRISTAGIWEEEMTTAEAAVQTADGIPK